METPSKHGNQIYIQVESVSIGSPKGPTFADFYMSHVESTLLLITKISNPNPYLRYVDDIFCVFND